jgi:regulator of replication initiation timing
VNPALLVALLGVIFAPLLTYVVAARRFSGEISHSEATDLWKESASIREDYRQRIDTLEERLRTIESENRALKGEIRRCVEENEMLKRLDGKLDALKAENESLHAEVEQLRVENRRLVSRVAELEKAANGA